MSYKEPSRKQQEAATATLVTTLKTLPLGEKIESLKQELLSANKIGVTSLAILRLAAAKATKECQFDDEMNVFREHVDDLTTGTFSVSSGEIMLCNIFKGKDFRGKALDGSWEFTIEDTDDGDARICKCFHSSFHLLDNDKQADHKSLVANLKKKEVQISGEHNFMVLCDAKYYNNDETVPEETVVWVEKEGATKWISYHTALAIDATLEHAKTSTAYGFMIEIADEQPATIYLNDDGVAVGILFETSYSEEGEEGEDGGEDDEFNAPEEDEEDD